MAAALGSAPHRPYGVSRLTLFAIRQPPVTACGAGKPPVRKSRYPRTVLRLTEPQIEIVMTAAGDQPEEKRRLFVERIAARLRLGGARFTDADLDVAVRLALQGLSHASAA